MHTVTKCNYCVIGYGSMCTCNSVKPPTHTYYCRCGNYIEGVLGGVTMCRACIGDAEKGIDAFLAEQEVKAKSEKKENKSKNVFCRECGICVGSATEKEFIRPYCAKCQNTPTEKSVDIRSFLKSKIENYQRMLANLEEITDAVDAEGKENNEGNEETLQKERKA